jgi:hypothetical protein
LKTGVATAGSPFIPGMVIDPVRIALPDFNERIVDQVPVKIQHTPVDVDDLTE